MQPAIRPAKHGNHRGNRQRSYRHAHVRHEPYPFLDKHRRQHADSHRAHGRRGPSIRCRHSLPSDKSRFSPTR